MRVGHQLDRRKPDGRGLSRCYWCYEDADGRGHSWRSVVRIMTERGLHGGSHHVQSGTEDL